MVSVIGTDTKHNSKATSKATSNADLNIERPSQHEKKNMMLIRSKFFEQKDHAKPKASGQMLTS